MKLRKIIQLILAEINELVLYSIELVLLSLDIVKARVYQNIVKGDYILYLIIYISKSLYTPHLVL